MTIENINNFIADLNNYESLICYLFLIIFGTAIINFVNFMDGLDGFICLNIIIVFSFVSFSINSGLFFIIASLCGFILWNWEPAKVFMGDTGSTYLGALLFGIVVNSHNIANSISVLAASFPILYRLKSGEWFGHAHNLPIELALSYGIIPSLIIFSTFTLLLYLSFKKTLNKPYFNNSKKIHVFQKAWCASTLIFLLSHLFDIQYFDARISILSWILLSGLRTFLKENLVTSA